MDADKAKKLGLGSVRRSEALRRAKAMLPKGTKSTKTVYRKLGVEVFWLNDVGLEMSVWSPYDVIKFQTRV